MKTTVEISDALFRDAKAYAARNGLPLRTVIELGLQIVVKGTSAPNRRFRLKSVTTKGKGLVGDGDWNAIRSAIYEGHGG